jgi:hypothetical protein
VYAEKEKYPFAYVRADGKDRLLVVLNPAAREVSASFDMTYQSRRPKLICGEGQISLKKNKASIRMKPVSYAIFRVNAAE